MGRSWHGVRSCGPRLGRSSGLLGVPSESGSPIRYRAALASGRTGRTVPEPASVATQSRPQAAGARRRRRGAHHRAAWPWASATTASRSSGLATGRAALDAVERRRPDLIVLDVMLPDLDGFEVARRLRQAEGAGTRVPGHLPHRPRHHAGQGRGPAPRQRRLRHQAVQHRGADRAGEGRAAPVERRRAGRAASSRYADLELDEDTRDVWRGGPADRADAHRVQAAALPAGQRPPGARPATRSSSTCGTTRSPATPACSRPTSATCATRSTSTTRADPHRPRRRLLVAAPELEAPGRVSPARRSDCSSL